MSKKILLLIVILLLITGCASEREIIDNTLDYDIFPYEEYDIITMLYVGFGEPNRPLNDIYNNIAEMYNDADYVVKGKIIKMEMYLNNGEFVDASDIYNESIEILVDESFKGSIENNTMISVLSYRTFIDLTDNVSIFLKNQEDATPNFSDADFEKLKKSVKEGTPILLSQRYAGYVEFSIGDKCLLFLTDNTKDAFSDKKVFPIDSYLTKENHLAYKDYYPFVHAENMLPIGGYVPMGKTLGFLTLNDDIYVRQNNIRICNLGTAFQIKEIEVESSFNPESIFQQFP